MSTFIRFATKPGCCRSVFIGNYFGDTDKEPCGICDYCLGLKKNKIEADTFTVIEQGLFTLLTTSPSPIDLIFETLGIENKEKIWEVMQFLESENRLILNEDGTIQLV
jgi:ATP-dependent DNA helicase RecQ